MHRIYSRIPFGVLLLAVFLCLAAGSSLTAQVRQFQCFKIEYFFDSSDTASVDLRADLENYAEQRPGLKLYFRDVHEDEKYQKRLKELEDYFGLKKRSLPAIYGLKYFVTGIETKEKLKQRLDSMLTLTAYIRNSCPHCRDAKAFLTKYGGRYPALKIVYKEVTVNPAYKNEMRGIAQRYRKQAVSLPVIHYCNGVTVGFGTESTTGRRILQTLDYWSEAGTLEQKKN